MGPPQDPQGLALSGNIHFWMDGWMDGGLAHWGPGDLGRGQRGAELPLSWPGLLAVGLWRCCSAPGSANKQRAIGASQPENLNL